MIRIPSSRGPIAATFCAALLSVGATSCTDAESELAPGGGGRYERKKLLEGLGEEVTIVKTPLEVYAELADGTRVPYSGLLEREAASLRASYGAGSPALLRRLHHAQADEVIEVAVFFEVDGFAKLIEEPDETRTEAIRDAIAGAADETARRLVRHGFVESYRGKTIPALFGRMPAASVEVVLFDERIDSIFEDVPLGGRGELAAHDPVAEHAIDSTWNTCASCGSGNWGAEVPVGQIEYCAYDAGVGPRGIYDAHQAFADLTVNAAGNNVTYWDAPAACTSDVDCTDPSDPVACNENQVVCIALRCVSRHSSEVASVIAASKGSPSGAAKIALYYANRSKPNTIAGHVAAYDWFVSETPVKTVNETQEFIAPQAADYFTRVHDIVTLRAAGNTPSLPACEGTDPPYGVTGNSICVGGATHLEGWASAYSAYLNPSPFPDREEPDVLAFGGDGASDHVQLLGFSSTSDWSGQRSGTSFSTPSVTSLVAHLRNECAPFFGFMKPEHIRAVVRTAAWVANPDGWLYSTPSNLAVYDHRDGGGWADAESIDWFCQEGTTGNSGIVTVNLTGGSDPPGGTVTTYTPGQPKPMNYTAPDDSSYARKEYVLAEAELAVGDRVRFTITWDVCATDKSSTKNAATDIDLDLFLFNRGTKQYIYGSQSVDDNTEGFDVYITDPDQAGRYQVIYSRPAQDTDNCGSSNLALGWAGRWGTPW